MAQILPVLLALLVTSCNIYVFTRRSAIILWPLENLCDQLMKIGMYFFLLKTNMYHSSFRKIPRIPKDIFEFFSSLFIMESVLNSIWRPLQRYILITLATKLTEKISSIENDLLVLMIFVIIEYELLKLFLITLCFMFLGASLHMTRCLDFRLLRCYGLKYFMLDALDSLHQGVLKLKNRLWKKTRRRKGNEVDS